MVQFCKLLGMTRKQTINYLRTDASEHIPLQMVPLMMSQLKLSHSHASPNITGSMLYCVNWSERGRQTGRQTDVNADRWT